MPLIIWAVIGVLVLTVPPLTGALGSTEVVVWLFAILCWIVSGVVLIARRRA